MKRSTIARLRFRLIVAEEYQPVQSVRKLSALGIWLAILVTLVVQIGISLNSPAPKASAIALPTPPSDIAMHALSVGDQVTFGKVMTLWLQAFDNQQGESVSFFELDYSKVAAWLDAILTLDERADYPLFSAARIYIGIEDPERVRIMVEFIKEKFLLSPKTRWEWMAAAVTLAKNEVDDIDLAIEYAKLLRQETLDLPDVPNWVKQMEPLLYSDNNEFDEAADLLLNLLDSGEVTDPQEFNFLYDKLEEVFKKMIETGQVKNQEQYLKMEEKFEKIRAKYLAANAA